MNEVLDFQKWDKIPRLNREIVITEKLDGTNAHLNIIQEELVISVDDVWEERFMRHSESGLVVMAASRKRYLTPTADNFGFRAWVRSNLDELVKLGPGRHYGEWWGKGIQRGYGLDAKVFSLFNVKKWGTERPDCCGVVPVLYEGPFSTLKIKAVINTLARDGSRAAFDITGERTKAEGIVVYHTHGNYLFKVTIENDEVPKGVANAKKERG